MYIYNSGLGSIIICPDLKLEGADPDDLFILDCWLSNQLVVFDVGCPRSPHSETEMQAPSDFREHDFFAENFPATLLGTKVSILKVAGKMMFLFHRWDVLN